MLLQLESIDVNYLIGFGIIIGLAFFLAIITHTNMIKGLISYALVISIFVYKAGYIQLWVVVFLLILNIIMGLSYFISGDLLYLLIPIFIMVILTIWNLIFSATFISYDISSSYSAETMINGTTTTYNSSQVGTFSLDSVSGALTWIIVIVALVSAIGLNVFGSGLSETSVKTILIATIWTCVFGIFSLFAYPLINSIPYNLGNLFFIFLTIIFCVGVFKQMGEA